MGKCQSGKHRHQILCDKAGLECRMMQLRRSVNEIWKVLGCRQKDKGKG